jgi:hypothetical protein
MNLNDIEPGQQVTFRLRLHTEDGSFPAGVNTYDVYTETIPPRPELPQAG